ncbi:MAG: hypothetical protein HOV68_12465, partial [Streptomycetaceae bacterium]|nr:hypothetical protein [Streptomycetaceae bacterium]
LRLAGATRRQVLRIDATEAALMVGIGVLLGALATAVTLIPLCTALALLTGPQPLLLPWGVIGATAAACTAIAVLAALASASVTVARDGRSTTRTRTTKADSRGVRLGARRAV